MTATVSTKPASSAQPKYQVVNPATGEVGREVRLRHRRRGRGDAGRLRGGLPPWRDVPIAERAKVVTRVAELFKEHADRLGAIATEEMGKPLPEAVGEADFCGDIFELLRHGGPGLASDQQIKTFAGGKAYVQKLPIGPLLGIMPWNYPFYQIARFAAPNLVLGNTIILKHAESVPKSALAVQEIMDQAGVPSGVYQNIFVSYDQVEQIIGDRRIVGVSLTGSERAGAVVAAIAGKNLKKCVLELGGSDAYVVLDTEDVKASADLAWDTRIGNTGQACNSNKRMIVTSDIYDGFVGRLVERAKDLKPGDPAEAADGTFAPLSSRKAAEIIARAGSGRRRQGRDAACRRCARRWPRGLLLARGVDGHHPRDACLSRRVVRSRRGGVLRHQRRGGVDAGQRLRLRPGRRGVQHRQGARGEDRAAARVGYVQCERPGQRGPRGAVRRREAQRLRT